MEKMIDVPNLYTKSSWKEYLEYLKEELKNVN